MPDYRAEGEVIWNSQEVSNIPYTILKYVFKPIITWCPPTILKFYSILPQTSAIHMVENTGVVIHAYAHIWHGNLSSAFSFLAGNHLIGLELGSAHSVQWAEENSPNSFLKFEVELNRILLF